MLFHGPFPVYGNILPVPHRNLASFLAQLECHVPMQTLLGVVPQSPPITLYKSLVVITPFYLETQLFV